MPTLEASNLHVDYGGSQVLRGVDIAVGRGEFVCLIGRNGVGKSTTMKALMGLLHPSVGTITYDGKLLHLYPPHRIARLGIGYVPEERRIFSPISVLENLRVGLKCSASGQTPWTIDRVFAAFPRLKERSHQRAGTLSGGEQQMLSIARTLVGNPDIVLIDEPTEGLAPLIVQTVEALLADMHRSGIGILLVEQTLSMALSHAQRVYVMSKGKIVYSATPDGLANAHDIRRKYLEV